MAWARVLFPHSNRDLCPSFVSTCCWHALRSKNIIFFLFFWEFQFLHTHTRSHTFLAFNPESPDNLHTLRYFLRSFTVISMCAHCISTKPKPRDLALSGLAAHNAPTRPSFCIKAPKLAAWALFTVRTFQERHVGHCERSIVSATVCSVKRSEKITIKLRLRTFY